MTERLNEQYKGCGSNIMNKTVHQNAEKEDAGLGIEGRFFKSHNHWEI
jgi:hypothetical protein